jgi:hypothetical protein
MSTRVDEDLISALVSMRSRFAAKRIPYYEYFSYVRGLRRADERTRTAYPCSLRVIPQALQGRARACKSPIPKRLSLLGVAARCTVLRSRWYQSGISRGIAASESCSLAHASDVRPGLRRMQNKAHFRSPLPLDALDGPKHCRRDERGVGVGDLLLPIASHQ